MARPRKNRPGGAKLRPFTVWLDPVADWELIDKMDALAKLNRASQTIRQMLISGFFGQPMSVPSPHTADTQPVQTFQQLPIEMAPVENALNSVVSSFLGGFN